MTDFKKEIIKLALELIRIGHEIIYLAVTDRFIDFEFRAEQINQILNAIKGVKEVKND